MLSVSKLIMFLFKIQEIVMFAVSYGRSSIGCSAAAQHAPPKMYTGSQKSLKAGAAATANVRFLIERVVGS